MKSKKVVEMPNLPVLAKQAETETASALSVLKQSKDLTLEDADDYSTAVALIADVKREFERADGLRRSWVDPLRGVVTSIDAFFKPALKSMQETESVLKAKLVAYVEEKTVERDRLLVQAGKTEPIKSEKLLRQAERCEIPLVEGLSMRVDWIGKVTDAELLPRDYLVPDEKVLLALTKARGGDPGIPGWSAFPRVTPSITAAKVAS